MVSARNAAVKRTENLFKCFCAGKSALIVRSVSAFCLVWNSRFLMSTGVLTVVSDRILQVFQKIFEKSLDKFPEMHYINPELRVIYHRNYWWDKATQQLLQSLQSLLRTALLLPELATFVELAALLLFKTTRNQYYTACGWSYGMSKATSWGSSPPVRVEIKRKRR